MTRWLEACKLCDSPSGDAGEMRDAHLKAAQAQTRLEAQLKERAMAHEQLAAAHLKLQVSHKHTTDLISP